MSTRWKRSLTTRAVVVLALLGAAPPDLAAPMLVQRDVVVLEVKPLNAPFAGTPRLPLTSVVDPARGGQVEFQVHWPEATDLCAIKLTSKEVAVSAEYRSVLVEAELTLPDGARVRSSRRIEARPGSTSLFEVFRLNDRPLTLAIDAEITTQTVVPGRPTVGRPVGLGVVIQYVDRGVSRELETNELNTFLHEPVTYRFTLGAGGQAPSVRLTMTPRRITGELLELDVEISGTLPGEVTELVSRSEQWVTTLGTASTIGLETGEPPTGYRFVVTPLF